MIGYRIQRLIDLNRQRAELRTTDPTFQQQLHVLDAEIQLEVEEINQAFSLLQKGGHP